MDWFVRLTFAQAAALALGWPVGLLVAGGIFYVGAWARAWWQARRLEPDASGDVIVTVSSWPWLIALLFGPAVAVLLLWVLLRATSGAI